MALTLKPNQEDDPSFVDSLEKILDFTQKHPEIQIQQILTTLSGKGYAALLTMFSFPFCFPVQIPGFSTLFGLLLAFLGLRIAFAKRLWWPKWILEKSLNSQNIATLTTKTISVIKGMQKVIHPRLTVLTQHPFFHRLNGLIVCTLALLLALPIPIPLTNMVAAFPIFCIGLGLLEDDGVFILIGYALSIICFALFFGLIILGMLQVKNHLG